MMDVVCYDDGVFVVVVLMVMWGMSLCSRGHGMDTVAIAGGLALTYSLVLVHIGSL